MRVCHNEGASGPRSLGRTSSTPRRRTRFNPTRVHLERAICAGSRRILRFNPTRVHLERFLGWYGYTARNQLQPNEGASGTTTTATARTSSRSFNPTRVHLELSLPGSTVTDSSLQPNEGASGTPASTGSSPSASRLQPNEGASGTPTRTRTRRPTRASTQRGCIWNRDDGYRDLSRVGASTQRGCIWNSPESE